MLKDGIPRVKIRRQKFHRLDLFGTTYYQWCVWWDGEALHGWDGMPWHAKRFNTHRAAMNYAERNEW